MPEGQNTQTGKIVPLTKETETVLTLIGRALRYFVRIISGIAIFLGVAFFIISVALGRSATSSLILAIGIIVANVPKVSSTRNYRLFRCVLSSIDTPLTDSCSCIHFYYSHTT